jgi:hypothetical protein
VPDGFKVLAPTFPTVGDAAAAAAECHRAEILYCFSISERNWEVFPEGNDEQWAQTQKLSPEERDLPPKTLVLIMGGHSSRELEYREKCALAISEKWGGRFLPQLNEPRALARTFGNLIWSMSVQLLRGGGDILPTFSSGDGSPERIKRMTLLDSEIARSLGDGEPGEMIPGQRGRERGVFWRGLENLSIGVQGMIMGVMGDPYEPSSLERVRKYISALSDPQGKLRRFGIPGRGNLLSIESVTHIHQNWGPLYDNYDVWLRKVKKMLDPNDVADWSGYIPSAYAEEGTNIPPSWSR